ncbi:P-loop containing nucleoside triphosphate hydrolase protein [Poronia punctata]|nr:P-loop containing nucleoside triphosphate hydrolase protein [Poronia punctata]
MTVRRTDEVSEEEFDLVDSTDTVSNVSSPPDPAGQPHILPGGHYGPAFDTMEPSDPAGQRVLGSDTRNPPNERTPRDPVWAAEDDVSGSHGADFKSALTYTKSLVNKFWRPEQKLLIAVMGYETAIIPFRFLVGPILASLLTSIISMTGSGKTTFISKVTGRNDLKIGHGLKSCTQDIQMVETDINGRIVCFIDTPGFSDTNLSDTEVLQLIADYLATAYKNKLKLSGLIYLHPISDRRMTQHGVKNLKMFQKLTGDDNLKNVMLATTMWDTVSPEEGQNREEQLKEEYWKLLLGHKAQTARHTGTLESARSIAQKLMDNTPFFTELQQQLGRDNKTLKDTSAGQEIMHELLRLKEEHKKELAEAESALRNATEENKMVVEALKEHYHKKLEDLDKALASERQMNEQSVKALEERIKALEGKGMCAVM